MRYIPKIFNRIQSGLLIGSEGAPNGRVTVEADWMLRATSPVYANSLRGPYRYYQDNERVEHEVPAIQSIQMSRSSKQNVATCQITVYNAWHEANVANPELEGQLGKPGFFWPKRGGINDASATWNQTASLGAYKHYPAGHPDAEQEGQWDASFSWKNALVEDALIRTYQGYGGVPSDGNYISIQDNIDNENVVLTGVWLVDTVIGNSSGMMVLNCRDVGRLLLDQIVFPPTIPSALYPLEYIPPGRSRFDSMFGSSVSSSPSSAYGSRGPVKIAPMTASSAGTTDDYVLDHPIAASVDGNITDFALTEAFDKSIDGPENTSTAWFEYELTNSETISSVAMTPWAGGYKVFVSAYITGDVLSEHANGWLEVEHEQDEPTVVPATDPADRIPYIKQIYIPETNPGGSGVGEAEVYAELRRKLTDYEAFLIAAMDTDDPDRQKLYGLRPDAPNPSEGDLVQLRDISKIRISIQRFYYSGMPDGDGNQFRAGLRTVKAFCIGQNLTPYEERANDHPWTWDIMPHPTRGYWVLENTGTVHGFGDAADYDGDTLGHLDVAGNTITTPIYGAQGQVLAASQSWTPRAHGMAPTPSGLGYWGVDWCGKIYSHGDATFHGQHTLANRGYTFQNGWPGRLADWRAGQNLVYRNRTPFGYTNTSGLYVAEPATGTVPTRYCIDIAATYTGEGYWVLYSDGAIVAFGDAVDAMPAGSTSFNANGNPSTPAKIGGVPASSTMTAFRNIMRNYFAYGRVSYGYTVDTDLSGKGSAITSHPSKMGFWVTNQCGEVFAFGEAEHQGGFSNRIFDKGGDLQFDMKLFDYPTSIVSTDTGNGYWILCNSGMVAPFGDAREKGPIELDSVNKQFEGNVVVGSDRYGADYFSKLFYGMARDQDGRGYWLLRADGEVLFYESTDWGNPGWTGLTGYRWHTGNFTGDYAQIVKEVVMWAGFTFFDSYKNGGSIITDPDPGYTDLSVLGAMESTAISADIEIQGSKWDKKFVMDIVSELSEVVGYSVYIDQEGGFHFESPNWWRTGNFDYSRNRVWVLENESGDFLQVEGLTDAEAMEAGCIPYIPIIHESTDLISYSSTLSNTDKKWQIIVGTDTPDPRDISRTAHVQHFPPFVSDEIRPGVPSLRNIPRTSIWTSHVFENADERMLMAEMVGIHNYFAARMGTTTSVANPCLDLDDQVRLVERNTSETYIHRVIGIDTNMNLDDGTYTMNLQTHWLGDTDNWVLVTTSDGEPWDNTKAYGIGARVSYGSVTYVSTISDNTNITPPGSSGEWVEQTDIDSPLVVISDRLDSWQTETGRNLQLSGYASRNPYSARATGSFTSSAYSASGVNNGPEWGLWYTGTGAMSTNSTTFPNVAYKSLGEGLLWPFTQTPSVAWADDGETYAAAKLDAANQNFIITLGDTPQSLQDLVVDYLPDVTITTAIDVADMGFGAITLTASDLSSPSFSATLPSFEVPWDGFATYALDDEVTYGGVTYKSTIDPNIGTTPPGLGEWVETNANGFAGLAWIFDETITDTGTTYEISGIRLTDVVVDCGSWENVSFTFASTDGAGSSRPGSVTVTGAGAASWNTAYPPFTSFTQTNLKAVTTGVTDSVDIEFTFDMLTVNNNWPPAVIALVTVDDTTSAVGVPITSFTVGSVEAIYTEVLSVAETADAQDYGTLVDTVAPELSLPIGNVGGDLTPASLNITFPDFVDDVIELAGFYWDYPTTEPEPGMVLRGFRLSGIQISYDDLDPYDNTIIGIGSPNGAGGSLVGSGRPLLAGSSYTSPTPPTNWMSGHAANLDLMRTYYIGETCFYGNATWSCVAETTGQSPDESGTYWTVTDSGATIYTITAIGLVDESEVLEAKLYFADPTPVLTNGYPPIVGIVNQAFNDSVPKSIDSVAATGVEWLWYIPRP